jgi:hypothetical protein
MLFLGFMLLFSLTYAGVFRQDDEHILAARAQSLALWGELEEPQVYGNQRVQALIPLGDKATQIEPAHALLAALLYLLGTAAGGGGMQTMFVLNIFVCALCVAVVYACAQALGNSLKTSAWTAILFGAGTMVWPFAATFYRDSLAMLLAGLAWLVWIKLGNAKSGRTKWALLLGLTLVLGLLAKNTNMALVLAILLVSGFTSVIDRLRDRQIRPLMLGLGGVIGLMAAWILLVPSQGPLARYSASYMWDLVKYFAQSLNLNLLAALIGPLISPAKSIFLFSPPLLLGLAGLGRAWCFHRRAVLVGVLTSFFLFLGQGLFYGSEWAGIYGWGLRYTLPLLPVLMPLLAAPVIDRLLERGRNGRILIAAILVAGMAVQLAGVLPDWRQMYAGWESAGLDPYRPSAAWDWHLNAILAGWKLMADPGTWLTSWVRMLRTGVVLAWMVPLTLLGLSLLVIALKRSSRAYRAKLGAAGLLLVSLAACLLPLLAIRFIYQSDPAWGGDRPDLLAAVEWVNDHADQNEPVVIDSYATPLWLVAMNHWRSPSRWYALAYEIPLGSNPPQEGISQVSLRLFEKLSAESGGLWYLTTPDAPDYTYHRESQWLDESLGAVEEMQFGSDGEIQVWGFGDVN